MAKGPWHFTVEGKGAFPVDMLRYDGCWPFQQQDAVLVEKSLKEPSSDPVKIRLEQAAGMSGPTVGRWRSFGWNVVVAGAT